jgi:dipeptide/tripeptide permease
MTILFTFLSYTVPIFGAWLADAKTGRFKGIVIGALIGGLAHIIMIGGAAPAVLKAGNGVAPFLISFILLAMGAGIFKPLVAPILLDQYEHQQPYTKTLKSGEKVIIDPETTIQRILLIFYGFINVGAFFAVCQGVCYLACDTDSPIRLRLPTPRSILASGSPSFFPALCTSCCLFY